MKKILTINRYSFALVGLITGWISAFLLPYRYITELNFHQNLLLLIPGIFFGIGMSVYLWVYCRSFPKIIKLLFITILAFPISVYTVIKGIPLFLSNEYFFYIIYFLSGVIGSILIGIGVGDFVTINKKNYLKLSMIGGFVGLVILIFATHYGSNHGPDDDVLLLLNPIWQFFVGFYIGKLLESNFIESSENQESNIYARKKILILWIVFVLSFSIYKVLPTFLPLDENTPAYLAKISSISGINFCKEYQYHLLDMLLDPISFTNLSLLGKSKNVLEGSETLEGNEVCEIKINYDENGNYTTADKSKSCRKLIPKNISEIRDFCDFELLKITNPDYKY